MGLLTMRLGEKADLWIAAKYAFGDEGRPPKIPGGAPVIFTVELLQVGERKSRAYTRSQLKDDTLFDEATAKKTEGNQHFKAKDYQKAVDQYAEGLELVGFMRDTDTEKARLLTVQLHQNTAMCLNHLKEHEEALSHCDQALAVDPKAAKALYFKSHAYSGLKELDKAIDSLKNCIRIQPNDRKLRQELEKLNEEKKKQEMTMGQRISNFLSQGIYNEKDPKIKKQRKRIVMKKLPDFNPENVQCFFDYAIGRERDAVEDMVTGRVVFELFDQDLPLTCENFRVLCTGEKGAQWHYQGTKAYRVLPGFSLQGGDTGASNDGSGGKGIYGEGDPIYNKDGLFDDENVWLPHTHAGTLSMFVNAKKNNNGSQYLLNLRDRNEYFDEQSTLFGRVISGWDIIEKIQENPRHEEKPIVPVFVMKCGELRFEEKLTEE